jgi:hypothetical protein
MRGRGRIRAPLVSLEDFPDPAGADLDEVRRVREDIERRVELLAEELLAGRPEAAHSAS